MPFSPLDPPGPDSPVLPAFRREFGLDAAAPPAEVLHGAAAAFARIPYENLTKIIKKAREGSPERARRWPLEVITEHAQFGAGGTCFSLTAALIHVLRALGFRAEPVLADRHYGADTHCALIVWLEGEPHLLDPGFLIVRPIPLRRSGETRTRTAFNEVVLRPRDGGDKIDLYTLESSQWTRRLTIRAEPAEPSAFLKAWDASFDWDMMRYPLLTRVAGVSHVYLQGTRLQVRGSTPVARSEVGVDDLPGLIQRQFGVDAGIAARAIEVLRRNGELTRAAPAS